MRIILSRHPINVVSILFVSLMILSGSVSCVKSNDDDPVVLTVTSWRTDDTAQMNHLNALFTASHPNITIKFEPVNATDYDECLRDSLEMGKGADILFLRSYDKGRDLYDNNYLYDLTGLIPNLNSFPEVPVKAWTTEDLVTYGVPSVGVTHGIYYQKSVFDKYNLQEPTTWDEFITICETLLLGGETVIAQGIQDNWTLYEVVFSGLGANFYGGEVARQALMAGEMKCTDSNFLEAFSAVNSLKKYFPSDYKTLDYPGMQQLFGEGQAALFIGGSWEISVFENFGSDVSQIGWFAPPRVHIDDNIQYCFHVDAGIGINKNTKNFAAALEYLEWVSGSEYAQAIMDELPGLFSYTPGSVSLSNPLAQKMFEVAADADLTVRLMCEKLSTQDPSGNILMGTALQEMLLGNYTPEAAAAYVQDQLDTWYQVNLNVFVTGPVSSNALH